jgi:2-C-methyl-D-erythritol 4-phosphate cytidylyltransferase/2-C-methyl-D-erythritol 2,4-cyclodiphosphate synthase
MTKTGRKQENQAFHLLIAAAGSSARMGLNAPKQYQKIKGKSVLRHTVEKFININGLKDIYVVINPENQDLYNEAVQGLDIAPPATGSNTRKSSIYNALNSLINVSKDAIILIHDAARPLIHEEDIQNLLFAMEDNVAATLATPVKDTLHREDQNVDREGLWSIQTPQAFKIGALIEAHEKFKDDDSFTDDAGIMRAMGHYVEIVPAKHPNFKITTPDDLTIVEAIMTQDTQRETRAASGFDVHAFEKAPSDRKFILGGVEINHSLALAGHSDADVVLHAITDALLGSINAGDIGTHFPPSDEQWKDADSAQFLQHAYDLLLGQGGKLNFVDVTIMAEEPKIGPNRVAIQNRIAEIFDIPSSRISIKATTTEKLGFTGRKEGIACQAIATITLPITDE